MSDLIKREDVLTALVECDAVKGYAYRQMEEAIQAILTIDAVEVVHGEWIPIWDEVQLRSTSGYCDKCKRISERPLGEYCKWCGAKMDAERREERE